MNASAEKFNVSIFFTQKKLFLNFYGSQFLSLPKINKNESNSKFAAR